MATTLPHSLVSTSAGTTSASDLLKSKSNFVNGVPLKAAFGRTRTRTRLGTVRVNKRDLTTSVPIWNGFGKEGIRKGFAKLKKWKTDDQSLTVVTDPNANGGFLRRISDFQPLKEKPKPVSLNFEKPLLELEKKIDEIRKMSEKTGLDFTDQIAALETKYDKVRRELYTNLTPIQRVYIARHPQRPTFLDHVFNMTDGRFIELHGDRAGYDDPAIVTGLGSIDGRSYMFIGQQKGRNSKENIKRNFGMPTPHGYRKALRMMRYADERKFPIITFVDTPGAYADLRSEELGQGEAIAYNLKAMFGLRVPVVSIVIGEGGSGGALGIACGNKLLMLENAVFYVASPEACAAILFKSASQAPLAAARLKITAPELCRMKIADGIIPEPLGGAHVDPAYTSQQIKIAVTKAMDELLKMDSDQIVHDRWLKFRYVGKYTTIEPGRMALINKKKEQLTGQKQKPFVQKEISKAKEMSEKFGMAELADVKKKIAALNADIVRAKVNGDGDLEKELKEKLKKMEEEKKIAIRTSLLGEKNARRISKVLSKYLSDDKKKTEELKVEISNARTKGNRDLIKKLQVELATVEAELKLKQVAVLNSSLVKDKTIGRASKALLIDLPEAQKKIEALKADIGSAQAGRNGVLEKELQEKLMKMEEEMKLKKVQVLKSTLRDFNKVGKPSNSLVSDPSDVMGKIKALKVLNVEQTEEMKILGQRIKKKLAEVKASSAVGEKHDKLRMELEEANGSSGGSDGTLKPEALKENGSTYDGSAVGINIGAKQEHN